LTPTFCDAPVLYEWFVPSVAEAECEAVCPALKAAPTLWEDVATWLVAVPPLTLADEDEDEKEPRVWAEPVVWADPSVCEEPSVWACP
jgi:hypothetical protein